MARVKTSLFQINGKDMFAPDADIDFSYEDLDDADSGRDESGHMHRVVVRYKVMSGSFVFSHISQQDMIDLEKLFPDEPDFLFTRPSRLDPSVPYTSRCYRSKYGISWHNAKTGEWRNYRFSIIEC
jgi:hypothetical protein